MGEPGFLQHKSILKTMYNAKDDQRKALLQHVANDVVKSISEIALNIIKGIIPVTPREKEQLRGWKEQLKKLSNTSPSFKKKRALLLNNTKLTRMLLKIALDLKA